MAFFDSVSNVVGRVTDPADFFGARAATKTAEDAQSNMEKAIAMARGVDVEGRRQAEGAAALGKTYDEITARNLGLSAEEYLAKQQAAAEQAATQAGQVAATQGSKAAIQAARTAGLSKGQAALAASQGAGDIYTNAYSNALEQGKGQYNTAAAMQADLGAQMAGRQQNAANLRLGAAGIPAGIGQSQTQSAAQQKSASMGAMGSAAGAIAGLLSDERLKTNIQDLRDQVESIDLNDIRAKIRPVKFEYKEAAQTIAPDAPEPGVTHLGVLAQDLEDTALAPVVKTDEAGIKRIDSQELAPALLNLIIQLAGQVNNLQAQLNTKGEE